MGEAEGEGEVRFALVKRVAQLTGVRVADAEAGVFKTVAELRMFSSFVFCGGGACGGE